MLASLAVWAAPQSIQFPASLDALEEKAEEVVDITLNADLLGFASAFMSDSDPDEKAAKEIVDGLGGVYVRSFSFAEENQYSMEDVEAIRSQLKAPEWVPVVNVRSRKPGGDNAQIFFRKANGKISGITVLATEPKELTIIHIDGMIDPKDIARLSGQFGIPEVKVDTGDPDEEPEN
jgi:hypothetical protein